MFIFIFIFYLLFFPPSEKCSQEGEIALCKAPALLESHHLCGHCEDLLLVGNHSEVEYQKQRIASLERSYLCPSEVTFGKAMAEAREMENDQML